VVTELEKMDELSSMESGALFGTLCASLFLQEANNTIIRIRKAFIINTFENLAKNDNY
jgi:hypothetical protein